MTIAQAQAAASQAARTGTIDCDVHPTAQPRRDSRLYADALARPLFGWRTRVL